MSDSSVNSRSAVMPQPPAGFASGVGGKVASAGFVFDSARQELTRDGVNIALTPKSVALLSYLLENPARVLAKDELMRALWQDVVVTDDSLVQCVKDLRNALSDKNQELIKTLPRRGYMLDAVVAEIPVPAPVPSHVVGPKSSGKHRRLWLAGSAAVLMVVAVAAVGLQFHADPAVNVDEKIRSRRSVAVLAFSDTQGRALGSGLADDMADQIGSQLLRANVRVIGRLATIRQDPAAPEFERIGQEQDVRYVVGGRITRLNGKIAVDTYLTEIATGAVYRLHEAEFKADEAVFRQNYGRDVLLALQERYYEIEVARARLPGREKDPADRIALAWRDLDRGNTRAEVQNARRSFQAVSQSDPNSVEATLGLGMSYLVEFFGYYSASPMETLEQAERALKRCLELASDDPRVLSAWAEVLLLRGRPDEAIWVWRRALEIAPDSPISHLRLAAALIKQGRYEEANSNIEKVVELRPYQGRRQQLLSQTLAEAAFAQGRDDEAYGILKHWAAEFPGSARPYLMLAAIDAIYWRESAAAAHMEKLRSMLPHVNLAYVTQNYPSDNPMFLAQRTRLMDGLRKAGLPEGAK